MWRCWLALVLVLAGCDRTVDEAAVKAPEVIVPVAAFDSLFVESGELSTMLGKKLRYTGGYDAPSSDTDHSPCAAMVGLFGNRDAFGQEFERFRWKTFRRDVPAGTPDYQDISELVAVWNSPDGASDAMQRISGLLGRCRADSDNAMVKFEKSSGSVLRWRLERVDGVCAYDVRSYANVVYSGESCLTGRDVELATKVALAMDARVRTRA
ncbi:sensor domain-containing protein [Mycobacteroides abscessus]|nr:sensor domain-containing protein [Mycobacteroides abscessus]